MGHTYWWQIWGRVLTLFGGCCNDGVSAGIWVIHTGPESGCKPLTLFGDGGYSYDGVSAGIVR